MCTFIFNSNLSIEDPMEFLSLNFMMTEREIAIFLRTYFDSVIFDPTLIIIAVFLFNIIWENGKKSVREFKLLFSVCIVISMKFNEDFCYTNETLFNELEPREVGCIIWENTFVSIDNSQTDGNFIFTVHSRENRGYMSLGIYSKPNYFDDSIAVLAYLPNKFIQMKNHTLQASKNTFFEAQFTNMLYDSIDKTITFKFKMNSSDLYNKNYFAFSHSIEKPVEKNGTIVIPKHQKYSSFRYLQLNSTKNLIPVCRFGTNIAARAGVLHPIVYVVFNLMYISTGLIYIYFMYDYPFKSRFAGPFFALGGLYVNLIEEFFFTILTYEQSSKYYCLMTAYFSYSSIILTFAVPMMILFRYLVLLRIQNRKRKYIEDIKDKRMSVMDLEAINISPTRHRASIMFKFFLKVLSSRRTTLLFPVIWVGLFLCIIFIIHAAGNFQCHTEVFGKMRIVYFVQVIAVYGFYFILLVVDLMLNIPNIFRCKWKKIFVEDDPHNHRLDMYWVLLMVIPTVIWGVVPLPKTIYSFVTELVMSFGLWVSGLQVILITIIKKLLFWLSKSKSKKRSKMKKTRTLIVDIDHVFNDEIVGAFLKFAEAEWSEENVLFKIDVKRYKKGNQEEREKFSEIIRNKYLIPRVSELEINAPTKFLNIVCQQIDQKIFERDLFQPLEDIVDVNIVDIISRFAFSSQYYNLLDELEK
eukprot:gene6516-10524_t